MGENAQLRFEIEKQKYEEERYTKLQLEIEHLTCKLSKMEQSRHVYEEASKQLGYFFELFSNQLPLSPYSLESGRNDAVGWRSRKLLSEEDGISSLSMSNLHARRKSTSCTNTASRRHHNAYKYRSTNMDCASDTSSVSQVATTRSLPRYKERNLGREEKIRIRSRTLDNKYTRRGIYKQEYVDFDEFDIENVSLEMYTENSNIEADIDLDNVVNKPTDSIDANKVTRKKSNLEQFLQRLKALLLKESKYDLRKDSYKEHNSFLNRKRDSVVRKKSSKLQS